MAQNDDGHGGAAPIGVGLIGAGLVVQSIHAPVLAAMRHRYTVRSVWDIMPERAAQTANRCGAAPAASIDALLADPLVDVVAICSPAQHHAAHAMAAILAGKRAVLVEKPLATDAATLDVLHAAALAAGTVLMVGSMHLYDPAWQAAMAQCAQTPFAPHAVFSRIILPPNGRFEQWATQPLAPANPPMPAMSADQLMRLCVLELAIHDLPLVRRLLPADAAVHVQSARLLNPFGYAITLDAGGVAVELLGAMHGHSHTDWRLDAVARDAHLRVDFTPSFVAAGSGRMAWTTAHGTTMHHHAPTNGYAGEWAMLADILSGAHAPPDPADAVADARFALSIADQCSAIMAHGVAA
ncbi:MAG: Gfo/Idh/MocA family protein [Sphingopyxis sp.]